MKRFMTSKRFQFFLVIAISASIIATGSYAWSSFRGELTVPAKSVIPDNVFLIDFSNQGGEIYAVNYSSQTMLIRVRLEAWIEVDGISVSPGDYVNMIYGNSVVSFSEWRRMKAPIGDYWVQDEDGWCYYAKRLLPGEATRMLLQEVKQNNFNILVSGSHSITSSLQAVPTGELDGLIAVEKASFSDDGILMMKYINGGMVEFVDKP